MNIYPKQLNLENYKRINHANQISFGVGTLVTARLTKDIGDKKHTPYSTLNTEECIAAMERAKEWLSKLPVAIVRKTEDKSDTTLVTKRIARVERTANDTNIFCPESESLEIETLTDITASQGEISSFNIRFKAPSFGSPNSKYQNQYTLNPKTQKEKNAAIQLLSAFKEKFPRTK